MSDSRSQKGLIAAIVFASLVISGSFGYLAYQMSGTSTTTAQEAMNSDQLSAMLQDLNPAQAQALLEDLSKRVGAPYEEIIDDDAFMGDKDAPVTIVEFSDYQCPFCQRHFKQTLPQIKSNYVETGKVKYVYRDFPLSFHTDAKKAANAAECARDQAGDEAYFALHGKIFSGTTNSLSDSTLIQYAQEIGGIDIDEYTSCFTSGTYDDEVDADIAAGASYGISGTPGFIITNGEKSLRISGAQPYQNFKAEFDKLLQ